MHWTERKEPQATLKDNATFKEVKQYLKDLKEVVKALILGLNKEV